MKDQQPNSDCMKTKRWAKETEERSVEMHLIIDCCLCIDLSVFTEHEKRIVCECCGKENRQNMVFRVGSRLQSQIKIKRLNESHWSESCLECWMLKEKPTIWEIKNREYFVKNIAGEKFKRNASQQKKTLPLQSMLLHLQCAEYIFDLVDFFFIYSDRMFALVSCWYQFSSNRIFVRKWIGFFSLSRKFHPHHKMSILSKTEDVFCFLTLIKISTSACWTAFAVEQRQQIKQEIV